ncbi:MAG: hypothetical protein VKJ06_00270 [Vampirovibrionales bacterium]|nr:hypothetical protein [Vampirovibrionales bacterium]
MRKALVALSLVALMSPLSAFAADEVVVEQTTRSDGGNAVAEIVLFPVRLVTGAVGAPIGAVAGLFTGFVKGFNIVGNGSTITETKTTTTVDDDNDIDD